MVVYETEDKNWQIRKQEDSLWQEVFGIDIIIYNICKFNQSLADYANKYPKTRLSGYIIIESKEKLKDAFEWLNKMNIITEDEMKYQISLRSENDKTRTTRRK